MEKKVKESAVAFNVIAEKVAITGAGAGLSGDDQIRIALQRMIDNGGQASMEEIYRAVEAQMSGYVLSLQGKASLRSFINKTAIARKHVYPYDRKEQGWRITPEGRHYVEQSQQAERVEQAGIKKYNLEPESNEQDIDTGVEAEETLGNDTSEITRPYDPSQINVVMKPMTVFQVMRKIRLGEIKLHPDFQRLVVWNQGRKSRLIESILIGIPLPSFYLDAVNPAEWLVVDGLQRLFTLDEFFNRKQLKLNNLEFLEQLNGKTFAELPRNFQRDIEDTELSFYIIQPDTPPEVKFTIFSRVNTGILVLKAQEIRHALFQGPVTTLLKELATSPEFKAVTKNSISPRRMDDRECVLRFLAFQLNNYAHYQEPDLNGFLSEAMGFINTLNASELENLGQLFLEAMTKAEAVFGEYAFRKMYDVGGKRFPINKALFEVWSVSLLKYPAKQLIKHKKEIIDEFVELMNKDKKFENVISQGTGSIASVKKRFSTIENLLKRIIK